MDTYLSYEELKGVYREGVDFRKRIAERDSDVAVLAPHGGGIEVGTSELALAIAGEELSYYLFEGMRRGDNQMLHVTSTRFDDPDCFRLLENSRTALTVHGCAGRDPIVYVGGRHIDLRDRVLESLSSRGFQAEIGAGHLAGKWRENICNRTPKGKGVQLEISTGMRRELFECLGTRRGRREKMESFWELVGAIREAIVA